MNKTVTTAYTRERLYRFNKYVVFSRKLIFILLIIISLYVAVADIFFRVFFDSRSFDLITLFTFLFDLLYFIFLLIAVRMGAKKSKSLDKNVTAEFSDDRISIDLSSDEVDERSSVSYSFFLKVCENKGDLYLFISPNSAYIVDITSFSEQEKRELRAIFYTKLGAKKVKWKI